MSDAPENCPGVQSQLAGKTQACEGCPNQTVCQTSPKGPDPDLPVIAENLKRVKHIVPILSGKGGVGKSTLTALLARSLSRSKRNLQIGVLDVDVCGPSQPQMLDLMDERMHPSQFGISPVITGEDGNLEVVSIGFLLDNEDDAVIWRGPKKNALLKQFLKDVHWDEIDILLVDTPPGTSDEHLSLIQLLPSEKVRGAILVTTPQEVSWQDVRKEIDFCRKTKLEILGVVENMSGFVCGNCKQVSSIFGKTMEIDGTEGLSMVEKWCREHNIRYLNAIPLDPSVGKSCDEGSLLPEDCPSGRIYDQIANKLQELVM